MKRKFLGTKLITMTMILAILMLGLSGCGTKDSTDTEQSGTEQSGTEQSGTEQSGGQQEITTLTLATYEIDSTGILRKIIADFEAKNPDIKIEYELGGGDQYQTVLKASLSTGLAADILGTYPGVNQIGEYAKADYLEDLTGASFLDNITAGNLSQVSYEGRVYGVPMGVIYTNVFYNIDIFNDLGIEVPKTWDEFLAVCETLQNNDITPISLGFRDSWFGQVPVYAFAPTTIYKHNIDFDAQMYEGKVKFNGPEWKGTVEKLLALKDYLSDGYMSLGYDQIATEFTQGNAGMLIGFTPQVGMIEEDTESNVNYGMFIMPTSDDGDNWTASAIGGVMSLNSESKNKEAALRFFEYFMSDDVYREFVEGASTLPVKSDFDFDGNPTLVEFARSVGETYGFLDAYWPTGVQDVFIKGIQEMFIGEDVEGILTAMDDEFERRVNMNR